MFVKCSPPSTAWYLRAYIIAIQNEKIILCTVLFHTFYRLQSELASKVAPCRGQELSMYSERTPFPPLRILRARRLIARAESLRDAFLPLSTLQIMRKVFSLQGCQSGNLSSALKLVKRCFLKENIMRGCT